MKSKNLTRAETSFWAGVADKARVGGADQLAPSYQQLLRAFIHFGSSKARKENTLPMHTILRLSFHGMMVVGRIIRTALFMDTIVSFTATVLIQSNNNTTTKI